MRVEIIYKTKNGFEEIEGTVSYIGKIVKDGHYEISVQLNKNCADKQRVIGQNVAVNVVVDETFGFVIPYNYLKEKGNQSYILRYNKNKKTKEQIYKDISITEVYYYFANYCRQQGDQRIFIRTEDEILAEEDLRMCQLIVERLVKKGIIKPEQSDSILKQISQEKK